MTARGGACGAAFARAAPGRILAAPMRLKADEPDRAAIAAPAITDRAAVLVLALVLAVTAAAYAPAAGGEFHWDDDIHVLGNPRVVDPSLFGWRSFVPPTLGRDRPLTDLTFALNRIVSGTSNAPYVYTNVAFHLAAVVLAWAVVLTMLRRAGHPRAEPVSLAVAALFALHPLQTEAVSFVTQRAESLASMLYLAALLLALWADEARAGDRAWFRWGAAAVCAVAALAAKPIAITFPLLLIVLAWTARRGMSLSARQRVALGALLAAAALVAVAAVSSLRGAVDAGLDAGLLGPWRYLLTEAWVVLRYLSLLFWPALSIDHAVRESPGLSDPVTVGCAAAVLVLIAFAAWLGTRAHRTGAPAASAASAGILWFFVLLAPTSSVVPLGDTMAEHRTYLANLGAILAIVVGLDALLHRTWRPRAAGRAGVALAVVASVALAAALVARNRLWADDLALWMDAARKAPTLGRSQLHAANALSRAGRSEEALAFYARAAELVPETLDAWAHVQNSYASALLGVGRALDGRVVVERAIRRVPSDAGLRETLAWSLYASGDRDGALAAARTGREIAPDSAELAAVTGKIAADRGDLATALRELGRAAALGPRSAPRRSDLAIVSKMAGLDGAACAEMAQFIALEKEPDARAEGARLRAEWGCPGP